MNTYALSPSEASTHIRFNPVEAAPIEGRLPAVPAASEAAEAPVSQELSFAKAASKAKAKDPTLVDKIISWFKTAGDFAHDISNLFKDGRSMLEPFFTGFTWLAGKGTDALNGTGNAFSTGVQKVRDWVSSIF